MTKQKKQIIFEIMVLTLFIALIIFGGRYERGYYAIASEPFVAVFGIMVIWYRNKKKK